MQEAVTINGRCYCLQAPHLRTFLHDIAAAVPVCVVVPSAVWSDLEAVMRTAKFATAGARSQFRVGFFSVIAPASTALQAVDR